MKWTEYLLRFGQNKNIWGRRLGLWGNTEGHFSSITHSVQVGVGIGVQGGKGLCSPPVRSDKEYLMLVYSRPLILLFCRGEENRGQLETGAGDKKPEMKTGSVFCCTPAPPRCVSAAFLCSAEPPCRWICTAPRSAPSQSAENEPSGWSLARRCRSPPLTQEKQSNQVFIWTQGSWGEECRWSHADSPFSLITSIRMSITINVPVLPIPALRTNTGSLSQHVSSVPTSSVYFRGLTAHLFQCVTGVCTCSVLLWAQRPVCSPASGWPPLRSRAHRRGQWGRRGPARPWSGTAKLCVLCCPEKTQRYINTEVLKR